MILHLRAAAWLIAALIVAGPIALPPGPGKAVAGEAPVIAAASNLQFALSKIAEMFQDDTGHSLKLSFGSSGNLARQIRQGAPYEVFLSADERYVRDLAREGLTLGDGVIYAEGRLALMVPHGSALQADSSLDGLERALTQGRVTRFAIPSPEHAPYGERAEEVLRHRGLWEAIQPVLVIGENVAQAAQFALSGNAEGGLIPYALALDPNLSARGDFALVPAEWHSPLIQRMVLLPGAGPVAEAFFDYLQGPQARAVLDRYGYALPGGSG